MIKEKITDANTYPSLKLSVDSGYRLKSKTHQENKVAAKASKIH